jgi:hypothetical protein
MQLGYYQTYFNVSTTTVLQRMKKALIPIHSESFFGEELPDLYTPFWIATTLIFILTVCGNTGAYLNSDASVVDKFESSNGKIVAATGIVYGLLFLIPLVIYCALTNSGSSITLVEMISLYGYSFLVFIPIGLI